MENGNGRLGGREVVIVEAVRTPVGRGHPEKGYYKDLHPSNLLAKTYSELIDRSGIEPNEFGLRSQQLAKQATDEGRFEREMIPTQVNGDTYVTDQGLRETTLEGLAALKPAFKEDGRITAGNSSQVSDGAAAVLLMSREKADQLGLKPRAKVVDQTTVGVDPVLMLTGPIPATKTILKRNGMKMDDIDLIE